MMEPIRVILYKAAWSINALKFVEVFNEGPAYFDADKVAFEVIDITGNEQYYKDNYGIVAIPTLVFSHEGNELGRSNKRFERNEFFKVVEHAYNQVTGKDYVYSGRSPYDQSQPSGFWLMILGGVIAFYYYNQS